MPPSVVAWEGSLSKLPLMVSRIVFAWLKTKGLVIPKLSSIFTHRCQSCVFHEDTRSSILCSASKDVMTTHAGGVKCASRRSSEHSLTLVQNPWPRWVAIEWCTISIMKWWQRLTDVSWRKARERGVVVNSNNNVWMNWWLLVFKCFCLCQFFNNKNASHNVWAKMKKGLYLSNLVHCQWTLTWEADDSAASSSTRMGFQRWTGSWGSLGSSELPYAAVHLGRSGWAHLPDGKNSCICGNAYGLLRSRWPIHQNLAALRSLFCCAAFNQRWYSWFGTLFEVVCVSWFVIVLLLSRLNAFCFLVRSNDVVFMVDKQRLNFIPLLNQPQSNGHDWPQLNPKRCCAAASISLRIWTMASRAKAFSFSWAVMICFVRDLSCSMLSQPSISRNAASRWNRCSTDKCWLVIRKDWIEFDALDLNQCFQRSCERSGGRNT